jgi:hypothetical protein
VPAIQITNAGGSALLVETGGRRETSLAPGRSVELAIEQPAREGTSSAGFADRPGFAGVVRAIVALQVRPREAGSGSARLGLVAWRRESARFGWPTVLARSLGDESTRVAKSRKAPTKRGPGRPAPGWRLISSDPAEIDVGEVGVQLFVIGIGPELADIAETFAALVRAAGETDTAS